MKLKTKLNEFISELKKEIIAGNYEIKNWEEKRCTFVFPDKIEVEMWTLYERFFGPYMVSDGSLLGKIDNWFGENQEKAWKAYQSKIEPMKQSFRENKIKELYNQINKLENENGNL